MYLSRFGEFDAEPAAIVELHQQNGMRQSELTFHHLALQHGAEEPSELCAMVGMNEQVHSWPEGCDPAHLTSPTGLRRPGALDAEVNAPAGSMPARMFAMVRMADTVIHTWDMSSGAGIDTTIPAQLVEAVTKSSPPAFLEGARQAGVFGPLVEVDPVPTSKSFFSHSTAGATLGDELSRPFLFVDGRKMSSRWRA